MSETYKAKSVLIGRKKKIKDKLERPCFVSIFNVNDPHEKGAVPSQIIDTVAYAVEIKGLNIRYLLPGNDILINNLVEITIEKKGKSIILISGKQHSD